ncbi:MAG: SDR family NAD(P)-dependent oxidoreductase [Chitinophagales bacterium]
MLQLTKKFSSKRAFITGAASGLGKEMSLLLAKDGWTIGMSDINETALAQAAKSVTDAGGKALTYQLDVADEQQYTSVVDAYLAKTSGIDVLINNAGVGDGGGIDEYSLDNWRWMIGINQMGVLYGCYLFVPAMKRQKSGHIINIASAAAFASSPKMGAYNMTKAAVRSLSETLSIELDGDNIDVSVVMPTFIKTNIMQYARGTEQATKTGKELLNRTNVTAQVAAIEILTRAGKGELNIVFPREAKIFYALKRFMPNTFRKLIMKRFSEFEKELEI